MCSVHHSMAIFNLPSVNTWAPHYRPQWLFLFFLIFFFSIFWSFIFILFYILMLMNQIQNKCKMLHNPWMMNNLHEMISIEFSMHLITFWRAQSIVWKNITEIIHLRILTPTLWVSRVLKYPKKCLEDLTTFFMSTWWGDSKNMEEIEFSRWLFEGRLRQGKNVLPDGLNWLCYFAGSSKSHRENSISFIFLESPHQVDMKNIVKVWKDFCPISPL